MTTEVSVRDGILDLYAPKFELDRFGVTGEKVVLKITAVSKDGTKRKTVFGNYLIGNRHAQIASRNLKELGSEINILSMSHYSLEEFIQDINEALITRPLSGGLELVWENGKTSVNLEGKSHPVTFRSMYTVGGRIYGILECKSKQIKIAFGDGQVDFFDMQRRQLSGIAVRKDRLVLERAFQH